MPLTDPLPVVAGLLAALVGTNLYWWHRERSVRQSLTVSRERRTGLGGTSDRTASAERLLQQAAENAGTAPDQVPSAVQRLHAEVRRLEGDLERARSCWADSWWTARMAEPVVPDVGFSQTVVLDDAVLGDVEAFGKRAAECDRAVTIVVASGDGTFATAVGSELVDRFSAAELAEAVADEAGGDAGGSQSLATGSGDAGALPEAAHSVQQEIARRLEA